MVSLSEFDNGSFSLYCFHLYWNLFPVMRLPRGDEKTFSYPDRRKPRNFSKFCIRIRGLISSIVVHSYMKNFQLGHRVPNMRHAKNLLEIMND